MMMPANASRPSRRRVAADRVHGVGVADLTSCADPHLSQPLEHLVERARCRQMHVVLVPRPRRRVVLGHDQVERAVRVVFAATMQLLDEVGTTECAVGDHEIAAHDCLLSGLPPGAVR